MTGEQRGGRMMVSRGGGGTSGRQREGRSVGNDGVGVYYYSTVKYWCESIVWHS